MSIGIPRIRDANTETMDGTLVLTAASAYPVLLQTHRGQDSGDMPKRL